MEGMALAACWRACPKPRPGQPDGSTRACAESSVSLDYPSDLPIRPGSPSFCLSISLPSSLTTGWEFVERLPILFGAVRGTLEMQGRNLNDRTILRSARRPPEESFSSGRQRPGPPLASTLSLSVQRCESSNTLV